MTNKKADLLPLILESGVCAIVRGIAPDSLLCVAQALLEGGVNMIEVTFNTPGAVEMIRTLAANLGGSMAVGAGTVLDPETARTAILAGASFVLSPSLNVNTMRMCQRYGVLPVPGVMTPTEIVSAWENGARIVKLFPAGALGARYLKEVKGPLDQVEFMVVGGIDAHNIGDFIRAGACSVGIGSSLVDKKLVAAGEFSEITRRAAELAEAVKAARA
ncbi:KHG/KDPG aldolase [bioreactor metagenome]|uniref:KHG/KDPG aldolase n=1 Tax=bioreactor metagenome TaxID=1076179 RepID=A0A645FYJ8_9ZZZZ